jgi:hypothetical protein
VKCETLLVAKTPERRQDFLVFPGIFIAPPRGHYLTEKSVRTLPGRAAWAGEGIPRLRSHPCDPKRAFFFYHGIDGPLKIRGGKGTERCRSLTSLPNPKQH